MPRILIVDDEAELRESIGEYLTKHGYEVEMAENGHAALEKTQKTQYSLIVTDVKMPHMTGVGFLSMFRLSNKTTPVILITGFSDTTEEVCLQLGATKVLAKPIRRKELLTEVKALIPN